METERIPHRFLIIILAIILFLNTCLAAPPSPPPKCIPGTGVGFVGAPSDGAGGNGEDVAVSGVESYDSYYQAAVRGGGLLISGVAFVIALKFC